MSYTRDPLTGLGARVIDERLQTNAVTADESTDATHDGNGYNLNTGTDSPITLTGNATTSAICYIKNNGDSDLVIKSVIASFNLVTGGAGAGTLLFYRNPTGGTIITNAVDGDVIANRNHGSTNIPDILFYRGVEADTLTGGSQELNVWATPSTTAATRVSLSDVGTIRLSKGTSIGFTFTTQAGNTSTPLYMAFQCYVDTGT